jgi:hypothetical protein
VYGDHGADQVWTLFSMGEALGAKCLTVSLSHWRGVPEGERASSRIGITRLRGLDKKVTNGHKGCETAVGGVEPGG